jgi:hypothetical protein
MEEFYMRSLKVLAIVLCVLALGCIAMAADQSLGIRDVGRVTFVAPIRVGTALLPAGDYLVRHTMEGQEHVMVFESVKTKAVEVKVKCTLVPLAQKAEHSKTVYVMNAANERVLQELEFRGDTAKHVF